jgi:hypothetical protein
LGSPGQTVNLLPDPYRHSLVVIDPEACKGAPRIESCEKDRGNVFKSNDSSSWHSVESRTWDLDETIIKPEPGGGRGTRPSHDTMGQTQSHRLMAKHHFGMDRIGAKALNQDWEYPNQGVISVTSDHPYVGVLGLASNVNRAATNPSSFFDNTRDAGHLKGVSWSYTAGSRAGKCLYAMLI